MRVRILYHDHCFDGAASAAFFSRFLQAKYCPPRTEFLYTGMAHKASQLFEDSLFDGDINAIVDFKYSPHENLTWWFDHHQSAFLSLEDAEHFRRDHSGRKFFDPAFRSCTKFIATVAKERFGFVAEDLDELVTWADIIDGAQYESPKAAVELGQPAMKLTLVIEGSQGSAMVQHIIGMMRHQKLSEIIGDPQVQAAWGPLYERHLQSIEIIRERAGCSDKVVFFDLIGRDVEGYNKFIPYYLFPESVYTVSVSNQSFRTKVSVGSNPWVSGPLKHNLATICEKYGGGGHPRVGAISFEKGDIAGARRVAGEVAALLKT
jgi:hypothetical protein